MFDQDFEDEILAQCLRDSHYLKRAAATIDAHHLCTDQHAWIWETAKDVWETHGELLTRKVLMRRARSAFKDEDERVAVVELAGKLYNLKPTAPKAALGELSEFVRYALLHAGMEEAVRLLDRNKIGDAYRAVGRVVQLDARPSGYEVARWIEEIVDRLAEAKRIKENPNLYPAIPTCIKGLDKVIQGIRPTEFGLIGATTNRGKSIMAVHLGYHAIRNKHGVVHISTEMHHRQVSMRYDSRWSRMVHSKFKLFDFDKSELRALSAKIKKDKKQYAGLLRIVSMPVTSARLGQTRRIVEDLREEMPNLRLVVLDSPDHFRADTMYRERRHEIGDNFWDVAGWAAEDDLAIWGTTQLGKQAADRVGDAEDVADNYDKARIADIVLTLNKPKRRSRSTPKVEIGEDDDDKADEERVSASSNGASTDLELKLAKYRDGAANIRIPLQTDLKRMLIRDREMEEIAA